MYELTWTETELREMFKERLLKKCHLSPLSFEDLLGRYFSLSLYDACGTPRDVFSYVIDRTFRRPRDIIHIFPHLRTILESDQRISIAALDRLFADYFCKTIGFILAQYRFIKSELDEILAKFEHSNAILTYEQLRFIVSSRDIIALDLADVPRVIGILYEIGVFGVLVRTTSDSNTQPPPRPLVRDNLTVEYCYQRRRSVLRSEYLVMHPIFRNEYSMIDNTKEVFEADGPV